MSAGRRLAATVLLCAAGAGLALWGITRTWLVTVRTGITEIRHDSSGTESAPLVLGLALVGLAGAGALLATRGVARRVLGALLMLAGLGTAVSAIIGRAGLPGGGAKATTWAVLCVLGGILVLTGGWWAVRHGHEWPGMGARYDRTVAPAASSPPSAADGDGPMDARSTWDALDRGQDPTAN
ncbi:Trp biosynthesis-associated membrane protein [Actinoplanes sp. N902-109]|uniref:Trp biosynthesis-associated membrane protein n=1 Tax=Actinoplanes sp. (strain N902-109) TaxID=649831 RepID=UPI00032959C0|nr:Trp biosynthesis-associated membrane protein [Actinoplanes sp. N902-109]AGL15592.1 trp biosynthesis associated, transmembrane protein, oprn/chp [Actinoplanes sp. N902-109]